MLISRHIQGVSKKTEPNFLPNKIHFPQWVWRKSLILVEVQLIARSFIPIWSKYWNPFIDTISFSKKVTILANLSWLVEVKFQHRFHEFCDFFVSLKHMYPSIYVDPKYFKSFLLHITWFWTRSTLRLSQKSSKLGYFSCFPKFRWNSSILITSEMMVAWMWIYLTVPLRFGYLSTTYWWFWHKYIG